MELIAKYKGFSIMLSGWKPDADDKPWAQVLAFFEDSKPYAYLNCRDVAEGLVTLVHMIDIER